MKHGIKLDTQGKDLRKMAFRDNDKIRKHIEDIDKAIHVSMKPILKEMRGR
jgi:hypothetical protein